MSDPKLGSLHPIFRFRVERILSDLSVLGWKPIIAEAVRTSDQQAEKVKNGYSKTLLSWHVPSTEGILPETRGSYDVVRGNAVDIVDQRYKWGGPASNLHFQFWRDLGRIAKRHGCEWGGDWESFPDVAHVQMLFIEDAPHKTAFV